MSKKRLPTDDLIDRALAVLEDMSPEYHSEMYDDVLTKLERLYALKAADRPERISKNQLIATAGQLAGILFIVNFERAAILGSKAIQFVSNK